MTKRNWEASPAMWIAISVVAGVTTAVVAAALQKWWGLKLQAQKNLALAELSKTANQGKYTASY